MARQFQGGDVNAVLRLVRQLAPGTDAESGDLQLSILTVALVTACRSCGVPKSAALSAIGEAFNDQLKIVSLDSAEATGS